MFSSGFKGIARALPPQHLASSASRTCPQATSHSASLISGKRKVGSHQRRDSSSKASCPPGDSSNNSRATTTAAPKSSGGQTPANTAQTRMTAGRQGRPRQSRSRRSSQQWSGEVQQQEQNGAGEWYSSLPSVPSTSKISEPDLKLSALFAMHRPLSLEMPIPQATDQEHFNKIFEPSKQPTPLEMVKTLEDSVAQTLTNMFEKIGGNDGELKWHVVQENSPSSGNEDGSVRHLDGRPRPMTVEQAVAQFKPYQKPPAPVAVSDQTTVSRTPAMQTSRSASTRQQHPSQLPGMSKVLAALSGAQIRSHNHLPHHPPPPPTIQHSHLPHNAPPPPTPQGSGTRTVRRSTHPKLQAVFFTPHNPMQAQDTSFIPPFTVGRVPFSYGRRKRIKMVLLAKLGQQAQQTQRVVQAKGILGRRRATAQVSAGQGRNIVWGRREVEGVKDRGMLAISVKRQRKLKMKKHKYKKLMKRTRTERRRLDK